MGAGREKPEDFIKRLIVYATSGQYGREWSLLHPAEQRLMSRARFSYCSEKAGYNVELLDFKVVDVYSEPLRIQGIPQRMAAVVYKVTFWEGLVRRTDTDTSHAIWIGRRWAWVFDVNARTAYKRGRCPA